jgi:O-antigen/teichoic acid export membrane protein
VSDTAVREERRTARSGLVGLTGAVINGALGFVLATVITRTYGADGSGALFTAIGVVTIAGAVCCLGADTGLMWGLPRSSAPRRLLPVALLPTLGLSAAVAVVGVLSTSGLIRPAFAGVPLVVAATVLLAAVRATRPVRDYVGVQFVLVPVLRPVLLLAAGGSLLLGFAGWLLPLALAAVIGLFLGPGFGRPAGWRSFWAFALPRAASAAIDASSMWTGVLLTGALSTRAEAGVFAAVGRYVLAGLLIMQGLRVAIAPQLSRLFAASSVDEAARVYRRTTGWIVLLSWPAYLLLAVFAPAFLSLFGPEFAAGATPMAVLAVAMLANVGVGLVQTVLLMSGNSRGHLSATASGLAVSLTAGVLLIPGSGALGAAIAWSLGIVCENVLAAILARRVVGALFSRDVLRSAAVAAGCTAVASAAGVLVAGRGVAGLAVALGLLFPFLLIVVLRKGRS